MGTPPYSTDSDLYRYAERVAEEAANWAHARGCGVAWGDYSVVAQNTLTGAALTQIAINEALGRVKRP